MYNMAKRGICLLLKWIQPWIIKLSSTIHPPKMNPYLTFGSAGQISIIGNNWLLRSSSPTFPLSLLLLSVEVTPDPSTAHPSLLFKQASREIRVDRSKMGQMFPLSAQRFTQVLCVLATQWFSSHRAYWEVEVEDWVRNGSDVWFIGVATESSMTSRGVSLTPEKGFWVLVHREGRLWPTTSPNPMAIVTQMRKVCRRWIQGTLGPKGSQV